MKKNRFRVLCVLLAVIVLAAQLFAVPLTTSAEDPEDTESSEVTIPEEYPENAVVKFPSLLDYAGTKVAETVTPFGSTADLVAYDYIEFDIYLAGGWGLKQPYFFVYDSGYSGTGTPAAANRKQYKMSGVKNQQWNHVRISPYTLADGSGTGNLSKAAGFYISNLSADTRYIIANVCLTDTPVPKKQNIFNEVKEASGSIKYRGSDYKSAQAFFNEDQSEYDISGNGFVEFDLCVFSENAEETVTLGLADGTYNGTKGVSTVARSVKFGEWQHFMVSITEFKGSADLTKAVSLAVVSPSDRVKYTVKNISVTDYVVPEMNNFFELRKETGIEINYAGKDALQTITSMESTDMTQYGYTEFDAFVSGNDTSVRLFFLDSTFKKGTTGKGYYDFSVTPGKWNHIIVPNADFRTDGGMNGKRTDVCGYMLDGLAEGNQYFITNLCYTDIPALNNKYELQKELEGFHWNMKGVSDPWGTKQTFEKMDATPYQFLEFDAYFESSEDSVPLRIFFVDASNKNGNEGRGFYDFRLTSNQWNHVVIERAKFDTGYDMNGKWSELAGFMLDAINAQTGYYIYNLCFTNRKQGVPYDEGDREVQPDQDARYLSTCESPVGDLGAWNSDLTYFTSNYKTEGTKSIALKVTDQSEGLNNFRFGLDKALDFSKTELLRFDMMLDDAALAKMTTASVTLSSSRRAKTENNTYELTFDEMHDGWNSVELPISAFKGDADLSSIKCFTVVMHSGLGPDDFFVLCIDNIRASKTFVVEGEEETEPEEDPVVEENPEPEVDDDDNGDPFVPDEEYDSESDFEDYYEDIVYDNVPDDEIDEDISETENQKNEGVAAKKIIRRFKNNGSGNNSNIDRIVLICVSAGCGLLLLLGLIFLLLTKRKLDKMTHPTQN